MDGESRKVGMKILFVLFLFWINNIPPVITGIREKPSQMTVGELWNTAWSTIRKNELNNLKFHYNGVVSGKWSLSPKYDSIESLENLIREKESKL